MTGDCHVRFCERLGVKFPLPTRRFFLRPKSFYRSKHKRLCLDLAIISTPICIKPPSVHSMVEAAKKSAYPQYHRCQATTQLAVNRVSRRHSLRLFFASFLPISTSIPLTTLWKGNYCLPLGEANMCVTWMTTWYSLKIGKMQNISEIK